MRIERLILARYGHLSDVTLDFPADCGLHVVLGANEAGKSTALAAIGDCLFGYPFRTDYAFLHKTKDLRLAVRLRARDGRVAEFVRIKRAGNGLLGAADAALPESAIAAFLGGATRERFDRVFGLDGAELRRGGQAMLTDKGDAGESVLQAHTGLGGFRKLAEQLGKQAAALYGDRRGQRALHVAEDAYKAARRDLDSRLVEPAAYRQQRDAQARLTEQRAANEREAAALHAERTRLERIRRIVAALHARSHALQRRDAMGPVATLPADAEAQRQDATLRRDRAAHDAAREREQDARLAAALAALSVDAALLAEAAGIDALAADRAKIVSARNDRDKRRIEAAEAEREVATLAARLGLSADADGVAARIPNALARAAATRKLDEHTKLATQADAAAQTLEEARHRAGEAEAALAALPPAEPAAALRAAIDATRTEGRIDAELADSAAAVAAAESALAQAMAALPDWTGPAEALAAVKLPLDATAKAAAERLAAAEVAARQAGERVAAHDAVLRDLAADLHGLAAAGALPTEAAIADLRARRDRAWRLLRRHRIDGGAAPDAADLIDLGDAATLPDLFETLLHDADALADRRASDAERIARYEQTRERQAREQMARDAAAAAAAAAQAAQTAAQSAWAALWQAPGLPCLPPPDMQEWLRRRADAVALLGRVHEARRKHAAVAARHASACATLAALLPDAATDNVAALLRDADRLCRAREQAEAARARALSAAEDARLHVAKAEQAATRHDAARAAWRAAWAEVAAGLGISAAAAPEIGTLALDLWQQIEAAGARRDNARLRIQEMTLEIEGFDAAAARLARHVAPDLADADPHDAVRLLAARLADARAAVAEQARLRKERAGVQAALAKAAAAQSAAEAALSGLRALAGAEDDAALQAAIARAAEHAALSRQIAEREAELAREAQSPAELAAEAEGVDTDALPGRLAAIEDRLRGINEENTAYALHLAELRDGLAKMEQGSDAAEAAQEMQNALADMEAVAARYVRLRLAHTLLRAGIDRFRREQQDPLLARAGALFARLTDGRYHKLAVEESERGDPVIVSVRPDGGDCPADRLSEGSRDQLYLALRLAAIESYAARGEPLPLIADDLLVNFDDRRALAALRVLAEFGGTTQTILFTHHAHLADLAKAAGAALSRLPEITAA